MKIINFLAKGHTRVGVLDGDTVVGEERIGGFGRVRDVREGADGALYVLSESTGRLYRLTPTN